MLRRKVMQQMLVERAERIDLLEQQLHTVQLEKNRTEEALATCRAREQTIVETLTNAQQAAKKSIADAEARAAQIIADAKAQAGAAVRQAQEKSARIVAQAESSAAEYAAMLAEYNEALERAAEESARNAASYAAFIKTRRLDVPSLVRDAEQLGAVPFQKEIELPPVDDDPAKLMQNIYRIQNRDIPDVELPESSVTPVYAPEVTPMEAPTPMPEPTPVFVPEPAPVRAPVPMPEPMPEPEPTPEPEQPVPTVEQFYQSMSADDDGMSLDALLDEIIKAGE